MLDELRALAVFAKVADLGSFRAAARALSLSPSVVSHHVSELERRLTTPLLYRSTRRLALTPDGEELVAAARQMVEAAERGLDALGGRHDAPKGTLRLTVPAFLAEGSLCQDLAAFSAAHPNVSLAVGFTDQPRDLLRDGLDLAIRVGRLEDSAHKSRKLADMPRVLVASPGYLRARGAAPRRPQDLAAWDHVKLISRVAELTLSSPGKRPVRVAFAPRVSVDSAAAMRNLVIAGAGLATLPELMVRDALASGRLVEVLPGWHPPTLGVHALWPSNAQRAQLTQRFVDFIASRLVAQLAATGVRARGPGPSVAEPQLNAPQSRG